MTRVTLTQSEISDGLWNGTFYLNSSQFTFSIPNASSTWSAYGGGEEPSSSYSILDATQAANFRAALALWDSYILPNFTEITETASTSGELRIAFTSMDEGTAGYAYQGTPRPPGGKVGDIWMNSTDTALTFAAGTSGFETLLHEIGHTLGLKHSFGSPAIPDPYENSRYTVMSYSGPSKGTVVTFRQDGGTLYSTKSSAIAATPMVLDIAAAQAIYGADPNTNSGNTVYTFTQGDASLRAIYDAGGTDTIDLSNFTRPTRIDLTPGAYSDIGVWTAAEQSAYYQSLYPGYGSFIPNQFDTNTFEFVDNLGIALNTIIENANGGSGSDIIVGNDVANVLNGNGGVDYLDGGLGGDTLIGGEGNDYLTGGSGDANTLIGGIGNDIYYVSVVGDSIVENSGEGTDQVQTSLATFTLAANVENLVYTGSSNFSGVGNTLDNLIVGGTGDDTLNGDLGADILVGGIGADILIGGSGAANTLQGGAGSDVYFVSVTGDSVVENVGEGTDQVRTELANYTLNPNIEELVYLGAGSFSGVGSEEANLIVGGSGNDILNGMGGNDTLVGNGGNDILIGGTGTNTLQGGAGDDIYFLTNTGDSVVENAGEGNDQVRVSAASYTLGANIEALVFTGAGSFTGTGNEIANLIIGGASGDTLSGEGGDDTLSGGSGDDVLFGGTGADILSGGLGADVLHGGDDADIFIFDTALGGGNIDGLSSFVSTVDRIFLDVAIFGGLSVGVQSSTILEFGTAATQASTRLLYDAATGILAFDSDGTGAGTAVHFATLASLPTITANDFVAFGTAALAEVAPLAVGGGAEGGVLRMPAAFGTA